MKNRTLLLLVCFITLCAIFFLAPKLLNQKNFQNRITRELIVTCGVDCRFTNIRWHWLPIPGLYIEDFKSESNLCTLTVPRVQLIPRLQSFFDNQGLLGRIKFIRPVIDFKQLPGIDHLGSKTKIPDMKITITDGSITLPRWPLNLAGKKVSLQPLQINNLNLKMAFSLNRLKFNGYFQSNLSKKVEAIGRIDLNNKYYRLDLKTSGTDFAPLCNQANKDFQIEESRISLQIHLEGLGKDNFKINLSEINKPVSFRILSQPYQVTSIGNINFTKHEREFFFEFEHLALEEPAAIFSGKMSKRLNDSQKEPIWTLDISGNDIDLLSVRKRLLSLWPDNVHARNTCSIVRGGRAKTARYVFKGTAADFNYLRKMKIWAEAVDVPLYISTIDLSIDQASGPISIIDGYLAGKNLKADIGSSHGRNASLWLDLIGQDDAFSLNIDLDTDLGDLYHVLQTVVPVPAFQDELERFHNMSGRAKGELTLGSALHDLDTNIQVNYLSAAGLYDRLPWSFKLTGRKLDISPAKVSWQDFQGVIDQQNVKKTSGSVSWDNDVTVTINDLDATADLKSLFDQAYVYVNGRDAYLKNNFTEILSNITGTAEFTNSYFSGPALHPEKWDFGTSFSFSNTTIESQHLPPGIVSEVVQGTLTSETITFSGIFDTFDQNIYMSGNYKHTLLDNWLGTLELNGQVKHALGQWVRSAGWIPEPYFPRLPLTLNNLLIINKTPSFDACDIKGEVIAQYNQTDAKTMIIDISKQKNIDLNTLSFRDGATRGKISYMFQPNSGKSLLTWQGDLNMKTLDSFFEKNIFNEGHITGVISRLSSKNQPEKTTYAGYLEAHDLKWNYLPDSAPIIAHNILINGESNTLHLKEFSGEIEGERLNASGKLTDANGPFLVDLSVNSENLTINKVKNAFKQHKEYINTILSPQNPSEQPIEDPYTKIIDRLAGKIDFNFNRLHYSLPAGPVTDTPPAEPPHTYTLQNPYGNITFNSGDLKLQLFPSDLCGMQLSSTYFNHDKQIDSFFDIISPPENLFFEDVLPCLGLKKSIIKGPFKIKGHLDGSPEHWHGGSLTLSSEEGIIKKMNILSKIFSVINFTDLFTWEDPADFDKNGLQYSDLLVKAYVKENKLIFDRAVLKGKGVNLTGRGTIDLTDTTFNSDLTFFVAPFKMLDTIVTNVPLLGRAIGGDKESVLTFPVGVSGPLKNPETTALAPSAVGSAALEFIRDTLTLPIRIFIPDLTTPKRPEPPEKAPIDDQVEK